MRHERDRPGVGDLFEPLDTVLMRSPLLPVEAFHALTAAPASDALWPGAADSTPQARGAYDAALVRQALALASPALLAALDRAERDPPGQREIARLRGKVLRFLIRMSTRPTPYGLFAGVALAEWGPATTLSLSATPPRTRSRPDMAWLLGLVRDLEARPEVRGRLRFSTNPLACVVDGRVHLVERIPLAPAGDDCGVSVRATDAVLTILAAARVPTPYADLVGALLALPGATADKAEALLTALWRHALLLSDLRPPVTTDAPARHVAARLESIPAAARARAELEALLAAIAAWDAAPLAARERGYRGLVAQAGALRRADRPLQVDSAVALDGRLLAPAVGAEAARAATLLVRLTPWPRGLAHIAAYRRTFLSRYGGDREVPLLELLHPTVGLGPPHAGGASTTLTPAQAARRGRVLRRLACEALRDGRRAVELDDDTIALLETWTPARETAPPSVDLYVSVAAASAAAIDAGDFQVVVGPNQGATSAGQNLGRFGHLLGPAAARALEDAARREEARTPDRLWAELAYVPHDLMWANVLVRPAVRRHEIPVGVAAGVPPGRVVPLGELVVGVRDGRFYARWPAEDVEVVATSGHMLNYRAAGAAQRFLYEIGRDGVAYLGAFDWGPASALPFLPRVQAGRVVLRPAQWRLEAPPIRPGRRPDTPMAFRDALDEWRARWRVPRYVYLGGDDRRLLLDLDAPEHVEILRAETRGVADDGRIILQEVLPALDQMWVGGPGGHVATELVISLVLTRNVSSGRSSTGEDRPTSPRVPTPARPTGTGARIPIVRTGDRARPPGSEWLYMKLYCVPLREDEMIGGPVRDVAARALAHGWADAWFFIRYADPDAHIRLRFRGDPDALTRHLLPRLCSWGTEVMAGGMCSRYGFDTYEREVERYGGPAGIDIAEDIFAEDSRAVADLVGLARAEGMPLDATTLAVVSVDDLLAGLGLDAVGRARWSAQQPVDRARAGAAYRRDKTLLRALLGDPRALRDMPGCAELSRVLERRRDALALLGGRLLALSEDGVLGRPLPALYRSYVHMHCNRLFGADPALERMVLGLLARTREGLLHAPVVLAEGRAPPRA